jgi:tetratricopeptide (TPR) repeat protein
MSHLNRDVGSRLKGSWGLVLGAMAVGALLALASQSALSAEKEKQLSRAAAKEMTAAQKALQAQQWAEALKDLDQAEAKPGLTDFDKYKIDYFRGFANVKLQHLKEAQAAFEKALATGQAPPDEKTSLTRTLFGIAASTNQYQKTIDYAKEMVDGGTATPNDLAIIAQSYYQMKDCKNSAVWADKAVAASRKAGEAPKENLYLFKLQCASDAGDNQAMAAVLVDLIKLTNNSKYWNTLLRIERQDERDDHNTLMIYRIMFDTGSMSQQGSDYIEMAQLLGDAALPGEAQTVLEKAMGLNLITDQQKERTNRLLNSFKTRAETDKKGQPQFAAEAAKNPAGELGVKLGEVYYGSGDYQNAVTAITQGLQKGNLKHPDEAYVYLGRANVQLHNIPDAKKAFAGLKNVPNESPRVLRLWELYADTLK